MGNGVLHSSTLHILIVDRRNTTWDKETERKSKDFWRSVFRKEKEKNREVMKGEGEKKELRFFFSPGYLSFPYSWMPDTRAVAVYSFNFSRYFAAVKTNI